MSEDKKRVCGTCAWWERHDAPNTFGDRPQYGQLMEKAGLCCYDPVEVQKGPSDRCHHYYKAVAATITHGIKE